MADQDQDGPSLELPSLGLGRKRKRKKSRGSAEPTESSTPQPDPEPTPDPAPAPEPVPEPEPTQTAPSPEPARPLFADEPTDANQPIETTALPATGHEATTSEELHDEPAAVAGDRRKERRGFSLPSIGGMPSAIITGALVGALTVALTWGALRGCEAIKGTPSCGGPGLLLLVAIMVAMIFLGSLLLRGFGVPDPGSTSFLAVGLLAVIALLFLVDALFNWWMVIIIPVLAILTFALSHWVTVAFIEPSEH